MTVDSKDPSRCIWVASDADNALVRITGRASFVMGPALKQMGAALIERRCRRIVFDMVECTSVDSTLLGVLAGLASRIKQNAGSEIIVINLIPPIYETVCLLGLNRIIDCYETGKCPPVVLESLGKLGGLSLVEIDDADRKTTRETAIEAHEALIRSDERNLPRFRDVLTFLRETSEPGN